VVGITVWGLTGSAVWLAAGGSLPGLSGPGGGLALFFALGVVYFALGYLLLGSVFLAIGSMARTVREVQTLSMPVTMMQLINFFLASYAMTQPAQPWNWPQLPSRSARPSRCWPARRRTGRFGRMSRRSAGNCCGWPCWCAAARALFRKRVMKSGPAPWGSSPRRY
jgi:ABC-2 type transport system permease protein